jgi:hypothetical protein
MSEAKRPILSLTGLMRPEEDGPLELATYDVLLPCRRFDIEHKVAVLGRVSLTAEFLLRLLKSADGLDEGAAAAFFGFDLRDMSFVLSEVENLGYVERREGRLWLTLAGLALFRPDSDQPQIFEVEALRESVGFDLLSLAPEQPRFLDDFERTLPELPLHAEIASAASKQVPAAFRRFYGEIVSRRERKREDKKALYSVDNVSPGERFSAPLRIVVRSSGMRPFAGEPDLSDWRSDQEQDDRSATSDAASAFVDGLSTTRHSQDADAYAVLLELAPEFLKEFSRRDGLAVDRYFREAFVRAGDVRSDRPTVPLLGFLLGRDNLRRTTEVLNYGLRSAPRPPYVVWLTPMTKLWGATRLLPDFLRHLKTQLRTDDLEASGPRLTTVGLVTGRPEFYLERAFDDVATSELPRFPRTLEIMLVPGVMVAVSVHAPIGAQTGAPVPLGFASFDPRVVERAQALLASRTQPFLRGKQFEAGLMESLLKAPDVAV